MPAKLYFRRALVSPVSVRRRRPLQQCGETGRRRAEPEQAGQRNTFLCTQLVVEPPGRKDVERPLVKVHGVHSRLVGLVEETEDVDISLTPRLCGPDIGRGVPTEGRLDAEQEILDRTSCAQLCR